MKRQETPGGPGPVRVQARVTGIVQGVGFRYFARREATRLGLTGWVANQPDGSVEAAAEGPRAVLEQFVERMSTGPPGSSVADVDVSWGQAMGGFNGFAVRSGAHPGD
jgi:acylphosphatase